MIFYKKGDLKSCGIYEIRNIVSGKIYIGSTVSSFSQRLSIHKANLKNNKHSNTYLQNSWNKHGEKKFTWKILEDLKGKNVKKILEREQFYLDNVIKFGFDYNISTTVIGGMQPILNSKKCNDIVKMYLSSDKTTKQLAEFFKISRNSIHRVLNGKYLRKVKYNFDNEILNKIRLKSNKLKGASNIPSLTKKEVSEIIERYLNNPKEYHKNISRDYGVSMLILNKVFKGKYPSSNPYHISEKTLEKIRLRAKNRIRKIKK